MNHIYLHRQGGIGYHGITCSEYLFFSVLRYSVRRRREGGGEKLVEKQIKIRMNTYLYGATSGENDLYIRQQEATYN